MNAPSASTPHPLVITAGKLSSALIFNRDEDFRLALLKRVSRKLGEDHGYPTFIKLLTTISESSDENAKRAVATTLGIGLRRNDLPGGTLTAWGASRMWHAGTQISGALSGQLFGSSAPSRSFAPIEYLTAWLGQGTQRIRLGDDAYANSLSQLIDLINFDADARSLYPQKLEADTQIELEGVYMRGTRDRLAAIASAWKSGMTSTQIASAALAAGSGQKGQVPQNWVLRDL
jgi:hypothetical protein